MLRCDSSSRWSTHRSTSCHTKRVDSRRRATRASAHRTNEPRSHTHQSRSQRQAHRTLQVDTTTSSRRCIWLTREVNQHPHDSQPHLAPTPSRPRIANRNEGLRGNNGELSSSRSCAIYTMRDCSSANALRHESRITLLRGAAAPGAPAPGGHPHRQERDGEPDPFIADLVQAVGPALVELAVDQLMQCANDGERVHLAQLLALALERRRSAEGDDIAGKLQVDIVAAGHRLRSRGDQAGRQAGLGARVRCRGEDPGGKTRGRPVRR